MLVKELIVCSHKVHLFPEARDLPDVPAEV